ncbi:MAG: transcription antitermination factor NusB [Mariprofundales bacterium]|nr:transcription antitermination factor NusB [Mariprofundales bacterium]
MSNSDQKQPQHRLASTLPAGTKTRQLAMEVLRGVLHRQRKAEPELEQAFAQLTEAKDRALLHQIVLGSLRHFFTLEADFSRFLKHKPDPLLQVALLVGAFQLRHLHTPPHAALHATVEAIKHDTSKQKVSKHTVLTRIATCNAVLRKLAATAPPNHYKPQQRCQLPKWIYSHWRDAYGADTVSMMMEHAPTQPPFTMAAMGDRATLLAHWQAAGIDARAGKLSPQAIILPAGTPLDMLSGFDDGGCTVMDQAAQLAALALPPSSGICLDICAAPGGKYALLSNMMGNVVALELEGKRMGRLQQNCQRLRLDRATLLQGDALTPPFQAGSADRIMLDAPCTASGLLRRHPDARFGHDEADMRRLAIQQQQMIRAALPLLKSDGVLAYCVCSIHPQENEQVIAPLLESGTAQPVALPPLLQPFAIAPGMARLLPGDENDGFFIALLQNVCL